MYKDCDENISFNSLYFVKSLNFEMDETIDEIYENLEESANNAVKYYVKRSKT